MRKSQVSVIWTDQWLWTKPTGSSEFMPGDELAEVLFTVLIEFEPPWDVLVWASDRIVLLGPAGKTIITRVGP